MSGTGPVLLVTGDFVQTGGMDVANHALAGFLARQGREVHLVAHRVDPALASRPGVFVHRVPRPGASYFAGAPLLDYAGRHHGREVLARAGRVVVNGGNCAVADVNWVHYVHAAFRPEGRYGLLRRLKVVASDAVYRAQEASRVALARVVVANSERTRADLVERVGIPAERVRVVYYGTDPERFRPGAAGERERVRAELGVGAQPLAVFVGALGDRRKGFDVLFEAWRQLCARSDWDAALAVVGRGAELDAWRARTSEAGLARRIQFLGFRDDVPRLLRGCDVLVSPARYEAYGLGVQEALCTGVPALVSAGAGVAERYPPELRGDLLLQDPESASELRGLLERWRARMEPLAAATRALSETLRAYTWDTMGERFLAALGER